MEMAQEKNADYFRGLPEEIWEFILEKLEDGDDILKVFQAYPEVGLAYRAKKIQLLFPKVVSKILPWLTQKEILNCRQVCKKWHQSIELTDAIRSIRGSATDGGNEIWGPTTWIGKLECEQKLEDGNTTSHKVLFKISERVTDGNDANIKWPKSFSMELVPLWKVVVGVIQFVPYQRVVKMTTDDGAGPGSLCDMMGKNYYGGLVRLGKDGDTDTDVQTSQLLLIVPRVGDKFYGVIPNDGDKLLKEVIEESD